MAAANDSPNSFTVEQLQQVLQAIPRAAASLSAEQRRAFAKLAEDLICSVKPFRFMDLPAELRNKVYEHYASDEKLILPEQTLPKAYKKAKHPAIAQVGRQVRKEALSIYYEVGNFHAYFHNCDFSRTLSYIDSLNAHGVKFIGSLTINVVSEDFACGDGLLEFVRWASLSEVKINFFARNTTGQSRRMHTPKFTKMLKESFELIEKSRMEGVCTAPEVGKIFNDWLDEHDINCNGINARRGGARCSKRK